MGNTEIFELCETSSKKQCSDCTFCLDCALYLGSWHRYCTCGKCTHPPERHRQMNKKRFGVLSIPGYVIKKNPSHGARHGPSVRQTMLFKAHDMLRKARSNKTGNCITILERWCKDDQYRKSLSGIGWAEEQIKQYDAFALEDHSCVSPTEERSRTKKSWTFSLSREGIQGPMNQRPDFIEAKHKMQKDFMKNTQRELVKETDRSILRSKSDSDVTNNSRCWMSTNTQLILEQDGKLPCNQTNNFVLINALGAARRLEVE